MVQLTSSWLIVHAFIIAMVFGLLLWFQLQILHFALLFSLTVLLDLIYLSSVIINNIRPTQQCFRINGKKVLVTGANSGIGFDISKKLVLSGAEYVVLVARNQHRLNECKNILESMKVDVNQKILCLSLDLADDPVLVIQKITDICSLMNGIDVLINCAGYSIPGEFENLKIEAFYTMNNTNYIGSVVVTQAVVPFMKKQQFGQIVFFSSVAGQIGVYGFSAYSPSKYALRGLAEVLYSELKPFGIGVSLVFPPDTDTPGFQNENKSKPKLTQEISGNVQAWSSEDVSKVVMQGIEKRKFMIGCGSDGFFLNALTCGAAPPSSTLEFWMQCILMPFLRVYILFVQNSFFNLISNEIDDKKKVL
uniref:3-dehydrosphinganine reductase n=1 Tax=Hydra vulgaris TaxID=6087 RepID=T2MDI7_HYDVU